MAEKKVRPIVNAEMLRGILHYDPLTGVFTHKALRRVSGTLRKDGRRQISIYKRFYLASRLAWLYVHGEWPEFEIDHKDRNRGNDAIENLREATHTQNMCNRKSPKGKSGFIGVLRRGNRWRAHISIGHKGKYLGTFDTPEEAAKKRDEAALLFHSSFAITNFLVAAND